MFIDLVEQPLDILWFPCATEGLQKGWAFMENDALDGFFICFVGDAVGFLIHTQIVDKRQDKGDG